MNVIEPGSRQQDVEYGRAKMRLMDLLNAPLPGGRGFQRQRDREIHHLCATIASYELPER